MSFILSVCGENYSIMLGDRQETIKSGNLYIPIRHDFKKVYSINENVCIGFAGDSKIVKNFVSEIHIYKNSSIYEIKDNILMKVKSLSFNEFGLKYIISGKENKRFITYYYDNKDNFKENEFNTLKHNVAIVYAPPIDVDKETIEKIVTRYIYDNMSKIKTTDELLSCMAQCIVAVSKISKTVDDNILGEKIFWIIHIKKYLLTILV